MLWPQTASQLHGQSSLKVTRMAFPRAESQPKWRPPWLWRKLCMNLRVWQRRRRSVVKGKCAGEWGNQGCEVSGQCYYGRGYIHLTWCYNYKAASADLGHGDLLLNRPDLVASVEHYSWDTTFWFWGNNVHNGQYAQKMQNGQFGYSTRAINGKNECNGAMEEESKARFRYYQNVYRAFGIGGEPVESGCYN